MKRRAFYRALPMGALFFVCVAIGAAMAANGQTKAPSSSAKAPAARETEPGAAAWQLLAEGVAERQSTKRMRAIVAVGTIGIRPEAVKLIEAALGDKDSAVRETAATTLGEIKSRRSIPRLQQALDDKSGGVCLAAAKALWDMGDRSGRNILLAVLGRQQTRSEGLVQSNVSDARRKMQDPSGLALMGIKEGLSVVGPFGPGFWLAEELRKDRAAPACVISATLLGTDDDPQSAELLEAALADKNWAVRAAAARALGKRPGRQSIAKLQPLLNDPKDSVRYMAAASIVRLGAK